MTEPDYTHLLASLRTRLELDLGLGVAFLPGTACRDWHNLLARADRAAPPAPARRSEPVAPPPQVPMTAPTVPVAPAPPARPTSAVALVPEAATAGDDIKETRLAPLREAAMTCTDCGLCAKRNSVVWGEGSLNANVMFVGEGPGRDEDLQGRPFVGRSGRLLTDIIEKGMKLPRSEVYITNVVKCRPPGNRDPLPDETAACSRYLEAQLAVIRPKVLVAVGGVAGCALLRLPPKSPGLRGRWHYYGDTPLRVIYHPSYLLRRRGPRGERTEADMEVWRDIQQVMAKLEE